MIPIHWDNFTRPVAEPLVAMPQLLDDFGISMQFLIERGRQKSVDIRLAPAWIKVDPFAGL